MTRVTRAELQLLRDDAETSRRRYAKPLLRRDVVRSGVLTREQWDSLRKAQRRNLLLMAREVRFFDAVLATEAETYDLAELRATNGSFEKTSAA